MSVTRSDAESRRYREGSELTHPAKFRRSHLDGLITAEIINVDGVSRFKESPNNQVLTLCAVRAAGDLWWILQAV